MYSGSRGFRLEIAGERFDPYSRVYFSQTELSTNVVSENRITAEVPANLIVGEGPRQIIIQTADGKKHSNQIELNVQAPPKPQFQYIGMLGRTGGNNTTAYFQEEGKQTPTSARLNDIVSGRFRVISVSAEEVVLEDVNLSFKHKLQLYRPPPGTVVSTPGSNFPQPSREGFPRSGTYVPYNPANPMDGTMPMSIPGIPDNIPRYQPPPSSNMNMNSNMNVPRPRPRDEDDDDDGKP
ncbi:MAG: hypothetical protein LC734_03690 [Acidobacteria bacterium]|nr:hypothetical protein [Acidobacteriota bacterium]